MDKKILFSLLGFMALILVLLRLIPGEELTAEFHPPNLSHASMIIKVTRDNLLQSKLTRKIVIVLADKKFEFDLLSIESSHFKINLFSEYPESFILQGNHELLRAEYIPLRVMPLDPNMGGGGFMQMGYFEYIGGNLKFISLP